MAVELVSYLPVGLLGVSQDYSGPRARGRTLCPSAHSRCRDDPAFRGIDTGGKRDILEGLMIGMALRAIQAVDSVLLDLASELGVSAQPNLAGQHACKIPHAVDALPLPPVSIIARNTPLVPKVEWNFSVRQLCCLIRRVDFGVGMARDRRHLAYKGDSEPLVINLTTQVMAINGTSLLERIRHIPPNSVT